MAIHALVAAFNRGSLDVPSGLLSPNATFALNGIAYETILGGSPDDPLIRMLARGAAGYRTAAKALLYALSNAAATVDHADDEVSDGLRVIRVTVAGQLRDSGDDFDLLCSLHLRYSEGLVTAVDAICAPDDLARIAKARAA